MCRGSRARRLAGLAGAVVATVVATGLTGPVAVAADPVPITQRGIAAVALEHVSTDTTRREAAPLTRWDPKGTLGADLYYHGDAVNDGDLLRTSISPLVRDLGCDGSPHCVVLAAGDESVILRWNVENPPIDPGLVLVTAEHGGEVTSAVSIGPAISQDPRNLDLEIPVSTLVDIATDPRLRLLTTQEVVDAGAALPDWLGGEPDPDAWDRVPQTDLGQIAAMVISRGGRSYLHDPGVSPLKTPFGAGTIGGRVERRWFAPVDPSVLDVLAAPQAPGWLTGRPCVTGRFAHHCQRFGSATGPLFLMWRPARGDDPGVVWGVQVRADSVVAVRIQGRRIPTAAAKVERRVDWPGLVRPVLRSTLVGLTTEKRVVDFDLSVLGG